MAVNQQTLEGNWNEIKGKIQEKWGDVTKDELQKARGNFDQLVGVIQKKTGEARASIEEFLDELTGDGAGAVSRVAEKVRNYAANAAESMEGYSGRARDAFEQTGRMVKQRPMESMAVGFGAGLIAGVVIGLIMRSR